MIALLVLDLDFDVFLGYNILCLFRHLKLFQHSMNFGSPLCQMLWIVLTAQFSFFSSIWTSNLFFGVRCGVCCWSRSNAQDSKILGNWNSCHDDFGWQTINSVERPNLSDQSKKGPHSPCFFFLFNSLDFESPCPNQFLKKVPVIPVLLLKFYGNVWHHLCYHTPETL